MRLRYFFFLLFFCSVNVFAQERQSSGFLSGLKQLGASFDQAEQELLPPDQAFKLTVKVRDANTLVAQFEPAKNYYLYKDKVAFKPKDTGTSVEKISLPQGTVKSDLTFGQVEVFHDPFEALNLFHGKYSQSIGTSAGNNRFSRYKNPEFDAILDEIAPLSSEDPKFQEGAAKALGIYWRDQIDIPIIQWLHRIAYNQTYWTGWPTQDDPYLNGAFWHLTFPLILQNLKPAA